MSDLRTKFLIDMLGEDNFPPQLPPTTADPILTLSDDEEPPPIVRDPNLVSPALLRPLAQPAHPTTSVKMDADGSFPLNQDGRKGEAAPLGLCFAPFNAVTKYCYKFVPRKWSQPLATAFFDQDKIYQRDWDLYYLNSDHSGVIFFVDEHQLQALITEINSAFPSANLSIGDEERDNHLVIDFVNLPQHLRPRWLGRCNSRSQLISWLSQVQSEPPTMLPDAGDRSLEAFKTKIEEALEANKKKTKANKARKHQENLGRRQDMVRQTLRAQRYLGMLPKSEESLMPDIGNLSITALDPTYAVPHPFDNEPIFIAVDVEAWEKSPHMITEVGIATLDTRDLRGIAPGDCGNAWHEHIRARHFRVVEYKNYINHEYVQGCPEDFEFGQSELVGKDSMASVLASCFREPFSQKCDSVSLANTSEPELRNLVIVGHDLGQDVEYCRQLGFNIFNRGNIIDTVDSANLFRTYVKDPNPSSLGKILYEFDISGWHLHNAGNDAVYTMQAMLAICVKSASRHGSDQAERQLEEKREKHEEVLVERAREKAKEDLEGWDSTDGDDGSVALPPLGRDFQPKPSRGPNRGQQNGKSGLYTLMGAPLDV